MVMRCRPVDANAYGKTARRDERVVLYRLTVATALPSTDTRADPRVGPRGAIHAIWLPVNVKVAVFPAVLADLIVPPRFAEDDDELHRPPYVTAAAVSDARRTWNPLPVRHGPTFPAPSVARTSYCTARPGGSPCATLRPVGVGNGTSDHAPPSSFLRSSYLATPVPISAAAAQA